MIRPNGVRICDIDGCINVGEKHQSYKGKVYRRRWCSKHKQLMYGLPNAFARHNVKIKSFREKHGYRCSRCEWVGPCDLHRIVPKNRFGGYTLDNVEVICPNCHRLEHYKRNNYPILPNSEEKVDYTQGVTIKEIKCQF